ncbi:MULTISPECIES: hypothetical protein [unclassified Modestobacter]
MPEFPHRPVDGIDAELRALGSVTRSALGELHEVRRRQAELVDMEAALVVAIEARSRRIDCLLDERLLALAEGGRALPPSSAVPPVRPADGGHGSTPGAYPASDTVVLPGAARPGAGERP